MSSKDSSKSSRAVTNLQSRHTPPAIADALGALWNDVQKPLIAPSLTPTREIDPDEASEFERSIASHLAWSHAVTALQEPSRNPLSIILGITAVIGALGTVWSVLQGILGAERDKLAVPWGEYANADGSLTHVYAQWYQGSSVRLRYIWGNGERDAYIRKMSQQVMGPLDDVRTLRKQQPKLPPIGLGGRGHTELATSSELPWGYLGDKRISTTVPGSIELIARARGMSVEHHFKNPETPPAAPRGNCAPSIQNGITYARNQIAYNVQVRQRIAAQLGSGTYAHERALAALTYCGQLLAVWTGTAPLHVKVALGLIGVIVSIELDLLRQIPAMGLAQEYGMCTRQIQEAADMLRYIQQNHPECVVT